MTALLVVVQFGTPALVGGMDYHLRMAELICRGLVAGVSLAAADDPLRLHTTTYHPDTI
jgi:hypothetical protein